MIAEILYTYHAESNNVENHRFRSWEHCYSFFREHRNRLDDPCVLDHASLHLAFYLASWGMLRNSILLQRDYRVHLAYIKRVVAKKEYQIFWQEKGHEFSDVARLNVLKALIADTKETYFEIFNASSTIYRTPDEISDTLISKILLGIFGVVPAYDRFFRDAAGLHQINRQFNENSFLQLEMFYMEYENEFMSFIEKTATTDIRYTPMKVLDMYFWKVGEIITNNSDSMVAERLIHFISNHKEKFVMAAPISTGYPSGNRTDDIRNYISSILLAERNSGQSSVLVQARDIHTAMNLKNSYPSVCSAMASLQNFQDFDIVHSPPSGKSSTVVYRYYFNRN